VIFEQTGQGGDSQLALFTHPDCVVLDNPDDFEEVMCQDRTDTGFQSIAPQDNPPPVVISWDNFLVCEAFYDFV
jgi:hypothetical protein